MERGWQGDKRLADEIKEKPCHAEAEQRLAQAESTGKSTPFGERPPGKFPQARSADDAIIMLGNAFPAKKLRALRASRHRLALRVIETSLISQTFHD
jgi:hypothetical protein